MKAAVLAALGFLSLLAPSAGAAPSKIEAQDFKCEYKPATNLSWEARGQAVGVLEGGNLRLLFGQDGSSQSALDRVQTTNSSNEDKVEARCLGSIQLSDNKPFRIRDFTFRFQGETKIDAVDGVIDLKVKGFAIVSNTNEKDGFDKNWSVTRTKWDRYSNEQDPVRKSQAYPFAAKTESQTVCASKQTFTFDDLRGVATRRKVPNFDDFDATSFEVSELLITFEAC